MSISVPCGGRLATSAQDVDDEVRFHLDARVDELVASGVPTVRRR